MLWLAVVLGLLFVLYFALYRRALDDMRNLNNFALLLLLDDEILNAQRAGLMNFVRTTEAANAMDLSIKVHLSVVQLAKRLGQTALGTHAMLWNTRKTLKSSDWS